MFTLSLSTFYVYVCVCVCVQYDLLGNTVTHTDFRFFKDENIEAPIEIETFLKIDLFMILCELQSGC